MPVTRAQIELLIVRKCRAKLAYAKLDSTTTDGTNADLNGPIAAAVRSFGLPVSDPTAVADSDLAEVPAEGLPQLVDVGELETLEAVLGNRASPDQMADTDNQQWHGKFYESLEATVARKQARCEELYGYGLAPLRPGVHNLGFAETFDPGRWRPV